MTTPASEKIQVWDRFVRFFHWSLVTCVLANYFVVDDGKTVHQWFGYTATALVLARIVWGFVGSRYARFGDFAPTPSKLRTHVRRLLDGDPDFHVGHNPLGGVMIFATLALVLALGTTGFMQTLDTFWGEEWLEEIHETLASALIGLAVLHVTAVVVMSRIDRTNLARAMITGIKVRRH